MIGRFGEKDFVRRFPVSRETLTVLRSHVELLGRWQRRMNLVGPATQSDIWRRHVWDSAQLLPLAPAEARIWTDLGSGGGFPGLVLAALLAYEQPEREAHVHLIESNGRKAAFLKQAAALMRVPVTVHAKRIEEVSAWPSDVVTARACADIQSLIRHALPFTHEKTVMLFPKGKDYAAELTGIEKCGTVRCEAVGSATDRAARIFRLQMVV